jgi:hypothetical protein
MLLGGRHDQATGGSREALGGATIFTRKSEGRYGGDYVTGKYTSTAYKGDNAEVMSMWMQYMAKPGNARKLIEGDPQHAALVLRILRPKEYASLDDLRPSISTCR